jgi:hypothetical protein
MTLPNGEPQLPEPHISRFQSGHCCFGQVPTPSKDQLPPCFDADRTRASLITRNTIEDFAALAVSQFFDRGEAPVSDGWHPNKRFSSCMQRRSCARSCFQSFTCIAGF